jgi:hypothetical protein
LNFPAGFQKRESLPSAHSFLQESVVVSNVQALAPVVSLRCKSVILRAVTFIATSIESAPLTCSQGYAEDHDAMHSLLKMALSCLLTLETEAFLLSYQQQCRHQGTSNTSTYPDERSLTQSIDEQLAPPSLLIGSSLSYINSHARSIWSERRERILKSLPPPLSHHTLGQLTTASHPTSAQALNGQQCHLGGELGRGELGGRGLGLPDDLWMEFGPPRTCFQALSFISTMRQYHLGENKLLGQSDMT